MKSVKFTTISAAKKLTGLSYLGSVASSSKIAKGLKYNEMTYILYLAPASQSGYNVCPMSTEECRTACLTESGHNRIDVKKNNINKARIAKTKLFFEHRNLMPNLGPVSNQGGQVESRRQPELLGQWLVLSSVKRAVSIP